MAVKLIDEYFNAGVSFNQETTLCGRTILKNIKRARQLGYYIELHYIGLESADIAKKRVLYRVEHGGHGIPEKDIEKRYLETFENIKVVLPDCQLAAFYDNTEGFRRIAIFQNGFPVRVSHRVPEWFQNKVMSDFSPNNV